MNHFVRKNLPHTAHITRPYYTRPSRFPRGYRQNHNRRKSEAKSTKMRSTSAKGDSSRVRHGDSRFRANRGATEKAKAGAPAASWFILFSFLYLTPNSVFNAKFFHASVKTVPTITRGGRKTTYSHRKTTYSYMNLGCHFREPGMLLP